MTSGDSAGTPPLSARIRDTFLAPGTLARELQISVPWLDVLLISTAIAMVAVLTLPDEIFVEQMRDAVTRRGRPVEVTSPPAQIALWGRMLAMLATLATHPLIAFTVAGALTLVFSILGRGAGSFGEFLALSAHALLIPAAGTLLSIGIRLALGGATTGMTLATLFGPASDTSLLAAVLIRLDPFVVWMLVALAVGVRVVDRRRSTVATVTILIGSYVALVIASTALLHPELFGAGARPPGQFP